MINGFEYETKPLNETELQYIPRFIKGLEHRIGENKAITATQITKHFKEKGISMSGSRVRTMIHHIRINNLVSRLVATNKGYYIENNDVKLKEYLQTLRQRMNSITSIHDALMIQTEKT